MNNKYYIGKNAQNFEQYDEVTISGVILKGENGSQFTAGDETGCVLPINCKYATQEMADDIFGMVGGKVYRGYRATNATLDPMAELGDGVTINGIYSVLAYRRVNFGPEHMSEIAAPGEGDLNHEYTYVGQTQKELDKVTDNFTKYLEDVKKQADAKAETWYQAENPSTGWSTEQKKEHAGDLWYNTSDSNFYIYNGTVWEKSQTTPPDYVFDQIDKKAQIFTSQPVPPYNEKDLWFAGENAPIKVCVKARGEGERFVDSDWQKKDQYIDQATADKAASDAVDGQTQEDIFNKLTDNGAKQGLILDENTGDVYINAKYLRGDTIDLNMLRLVGTLCGLMQGEGATKDGTTTTGIVIYGNGLDDNGHAKPPYLIVTTAGVRVQVSEDTNFAVSGKTAEMIGDITASGNISAGGNLYAGKKLAAMYESSTNLMTYGNSSFRSWLSGKQTYVGEFVKGYEAAIRGETVTITASKINETVQPTITSDEREKKDIVPLPDTYIRVFDNISPVLFRYKFEDDNAPLHMGYTTQNVQSALSCAGMTGADMAAIREYENKDGEKRMALAYGELIALLHLKIKSLENEINMIKENLKNEN